MDNRTSTDQTDARPAASGYVRAMPIKTLLALVTVVGAAHWLLLSPGVGRILLADSSPPPLVTRVVPAAIEPVPAPAPAAVPVRPLPAPPPPVVTKPAPNPASKPRPAANKTSPAPAVSTQPVTPTLPDIKKEEIPPLASAEYAQTATNSIANTVTKTVATPTSKTALPSDMVVPDKPPVHAQAQASAQPQASASEAYQFPPSIELSYNAAVVRDGQPLQGSGSLQWKSDGSTYEVRLQSTALFVNLLTWASTGSVGAQGLQPDKFSDKRVRRSEQVAHFERDKARISFSNNRPPVALQGGAQDRTSVSLQLAALLAGAPERYTQGNSISLQVASADDADVWVFNIEGFERVEVPAGNTPAIHLTRNPRREFDARLEFWFAPELNYLPIRIKQTESNGNSFDLVLRSPRVRTPP